VLSRRWGLGVLFALILIGVTSGYATVVATVSARPRVVAASCTAQEKARRVAALKRYAATMLSARRAFFRSHRSVSARRAFVKRQQAKLRALRRAASCTVQVAAGSRVVATVAIPNDGPATVAGNAVWVVDREGGAANPDGTPKGSIFRVDATTNAVTDEIKGVAGDWGAFGFGSVWIGGFGFNAVFRIDTTGHVVDRLSSGPSNDEGPEGVAITASGVWVANHHGGTVAELNPVTGAVMRSLRLIAPGPSGPQNLLVDGNDLWVELVRDNAVARVDITTGMVVQRVTVLGGVCGGIASSPTHIWIASGECGTGLLSVIDRRTGTVAELPTSEPIDVAVAFGSVWVATIFPTRLLRIDPATRKIVGSLSLPGVPWNIAVGTDALWVRVAGSVLRVVPAGLADGQAR
jgi:hypothetical protein